MTECVAPQWRHISRLSSFSIVEVSGVMFSKILNKLTTQKNGMMSSEQKQLMNRLRQVSKVDSSLSGAPSLSNVYWVQWMPRLTSIDGMMIHGSQLAQLMDASGVTKTSTLTHLHIRQGHVEPVALEVIATLVSSLTISGNSLTSVKKVRTILNSHM
jgi:hypothetical protein